MKLGNLYTPLLVALLLGSTTTTRAFELSSPDLKPGATIDSRQVFNSFGCSGENISPALEWKNAPQGTRSFALLVHDPDAPTGGAGWWHWLVYNIPATVTALPPGAGTPDGAALPAGAVQPATDFGTPGWGGPCPPIGDKAHHYRFTLHALKVEKLDLPPGASASLVGYMVNANTIGRALLVGVYGRKK
ncbi:MAG: YbhB/YbcL family Raf kinase inhibitor-like protein [Rugosibacter sp.]|nr:YbhB/YbcL family Raf kinase inhibitor-like protein [Rugosibacter sp.]